MTELPPCHIATFASEWQDEFHELSPLSTVLRLEERGEMLPLRCLCLLLSLHHYLPQYVAVNPNLSITLTGKGPGSSNGGQGQRSVRHGANFCGRTRDLMCVYYEAFNALNCEMTTTTTSRGEITTVTTTIMATKRPLINNKLNTQ